MTLSDKMAKSEVIDLCLSDTPVVSQKPRVLPQSTATADYISLSGDSDGGLDMGETWEYKQSKRRKISSPSLDPAAVLPFDAVQQESMSATWSSPRSTTRHHTLTSSCSDPIAFTSSPPDHLWSTFASRQPLLDNRMKGNDSLEQDIIAAASSSSRDRPKLVPQLSDRTAALLADLSCNPQSGTGGQGRSGKGTGFSRQGNGRRLIKASRRTKDTSDPIGDDLGGDSDPAGGPLPSQTKSRKPKLSNVEREKRAQDKELEKELEKARRQKIKADKARDKQIAADLVSVNRSRTDRKITTPEMIVDMPSSLDGTILAEHVRTFLKNLGVQVCTNITQVPNVIKWRRKVASHYNEDLGHWEPIPETVQKEKQIICYLAAKEFVNLACAQSTESGGPDLEAHVCGLNVYYGDCRPIYLIEGLTTWMRKNKNVRNRVYQAAVRDEGADEAAPITQQSPSRRSKPIPEYIDADMIEDALLRLQIMHKCLIHHSSTAVETAEWISHFTQHVSTIPYR